ncbi:hypothetical protein EI94DRAFT_1805864 [Lactarius quietus]|nr:hypothetical protein EI94DRAFT_1805864 [Lactarius quietus]
MPFVDFFDQDAGNSGTGATSADTTLCHAMANAAEPANTGDAADSAVPAGTSDVDDPDDIADADLLEHLSSSDPITTTNLQQDRPVGAQPSAPLGNYERYTAPIQPTNQTQLEPMDRTPRLPVHRTLSTW